MYRWIEYKNVHWISPLILAILMKKSMNFRGGRVSLWLSCYSYEEYTQWPKSPKNSLKECVFEKYTPTDKKKQKIKREIHRKIKCKFYFTGSKHYKQNSKVFNYYDILQSAVSILTVWKFFPDLVDKFPDFSPILLCPPLCCSTCCFVMVFLNASNQLK